MIGGRTRALWSTTEPSARGARAGIVLTGLLLLSIFVPTPRASARERTVLEFGASVGPSWSSLSDNPSRTAVRARLWAGPSWGTGSVRVGVANGRFGSEDQALDYLTFPVEFVVSGRHPYFAGGFEVRTLVGDSPEFRVSPRQTVPIFRQGDFALTGAFGMKTEGRWRGYGEVRVAFGFPDLYTDEIKALFGNDSTRSYVFELSLGFMGWVR